MNVEPREAIAGKVAIVTGASSGIGEATAREFAAAGARTVLAARRTGRLERLAAEIHDAGGTALPVTTDITDPQQIRNLVNSTLDAFGRIDILANIAGWAHYDWFEELTTEALRNAYDVNIIGMGELIRQVLPTMQAQGSGTIINMSSYASRIAVPPLTVYASTKAAVDGLTDGLRRELKPWGINVIRLHPSAVSGTEFRDKAVANGGVTYKSLPLGRVSREHVARKVIDMVEHPRRSLYTSRLYDLPLAINALAPGFIDWNSATWVKAKRRHERKPARELAPVQYAGVPLLYKLVFVGLGVFLASRFLNR